jgi:hypothetical protein
VAERRLWFRTKKYGWGWYPASWQGWLCVAAYVAAISASVWIMGRYGEAASFAVPLALLGTILASLALVTVSWRRGENPSWRWGKD